MTLPNGLPHSRTPEPRGQPCRMGTARQAAGLLAAPLLVVALGWGMVRVGLPRPAALRVLGPTSGPAYTVGDLQRRLAHDPQDWLGRPILVEGRVTTHDTRIAASNNVVLCMALTEPGAPTGATGLTLAWGGTNPLLGFLRHLPLIGLLAPQQQALHRAGTATYRVRLRAVPGGACALAAGYEALLLDATPDPR